MNLSDVLETIANAYPDRVALVHGPAAYTFSGLADRAARLGRYLADRGLGCFAERSELANHQTGQHMLAQYLRNGTHYVEGLFGAYRARVAPFNVNYLYQAEELSYLLRNAGPAAIQYHAEFAPRLAEVLPSLTPPPLLLQVDDGSGHPLLPGAVDYESALQSVPASVPSVPSPDDLYVIYTGGTTGMPKGVLWRQADVAVATLGLQNRRAGREWRSLDDLGEAVRRKPSRVLPCAPLMHGASQWAALGALCEGNAVVFPDDARTFNAAQVLSAVERHQVTALTIVGDAFGYPLVEELERGGRDMSSLRTLVSGGAALHPRVRRRLQELIPHLRVVENIGSSESGVQGSRHSHSSEPAASEAFFPDANTVIVAGDFSGMLRPGDAGSHVTGWLARRGRIPLGYLGDEGKTAQTFPIIDGIRVTIPGDRVRLLPDGRVELLGRDSLTINTGGEKVYVEEVESVLKDHPDIIDAVVCGRQSVRWGSEVVAVVHGHPGIEIDELKEFCRDRLARYKVPKAFRVVNKIRRGPAGKPDYRWAAKQFEQDLTD
ncbi:AMP-binding protein [Mycolicibacter kumamotonensis]|uniref:AMP-binding protein n=1 Tax=Mycolicibacter kumamotonensis TaxID=354243 RepID=UPI001F1F5C55|nr:AMP-binding protein [Mycolicibacter kumamotonensis]